MTTRKYVSLPVLVVSIGLGLFLRHNPYLIGQSVIQIQLKKNNNNKKDKASKYTNLDGSKINFHVITKNKYLDTILDNHRKGELDNDYGPYRNHCLRVLSLSQYYYTELIGKQLTTRQIDALAIGLAYHDIGLWIKDGPHLNYLPPSAKQAELELSIEQQKKWGIQPLLTATEKEVINQIVWQHHKVTSWKSSKKDKVQLGADDVALVNAIRKSDWADFTFGIIRWSLPASHTEITLLEIPEAGFHNILFGMGPRLSPHSLIGQLAVLKILRW